MLAVAQSGQVSGIIALLQERGLRLSATEKYLLVCMLYTFGSSRSEDTAVELANKFGVSPVTLRRARDGLLSKELLQSESVYVRHPKEQLGTGLRGRPKIGLRVRFERLPRSEKIDGTSESEEHLQSVIHDLFLGKDLVPRAIKGKGRTGMENRLQAEAKVLLAVLWAFSNKFGVVSGIGRAELAVVAGVSVGQVMTISQKLERLGYISNWLPGRTCRGLFGVGAGIWVLGSVGSRRWEHCEKTVISHELDLFNQLILRVETLRELGAELERSPKPALQEMERYSAAWGAVWGAISEYMPDEGRHEMDWSEDMDSALFLRSAWSGRCRVDRMIVDPHAGRAMKYQKARLILYASELAAGMDGRMAEEPTIDGNQELLSRIREEAVPKRFEPEESDWLARLLFGVIWKLANEMLKLYPSRDGVRYVPLPDADYRIESLGA